MLTLFGSPSLSLPSQHSKPSHVIKSENILFRLFEVFCRSLRLVSLYATLILCSRLVSFGILFSSCLVRFCSELHFILLCLSCVVCVRSLCVSLKCRRLCLLLENKQTDWLAAAAGIEGRGLWGHQLDEGGDEGVGALMIQLQSLSREGIQM